MQYVSHLLVLLLKGLILFWQWVLSPVLGANCRFQPSCSHYAAEALSRHGAWRGSWLAARRILSCNPWGGAGYNPVPGVQDCTGHNGAGLHQTPHGAAMQTHTPHGNAVQTPRS